MDVVAGGALFAEAAGGLLAEHGVLGDFLMATDTQLADG